MIPGLAPSFAGGGGSFRPVENGQVKIKDNSGKIVALNARFQP